MALSLNLKTFDSFQNLFNLYLSNVKPFDYVASR